MVLDRRVVIIKALRAKYPEYEWLPLVGLIHDLGKILVLPEFGGLPQWATVGDKCVVLAKFVLTLKLSCRLRPFREDRQA